jgi:hypothetical protein
MLIWGHDFNVTFNAISGNVYVFNCAAVVHIIPSKL